MEAILISGCENANFRTFEIFARLFAIPIFLLVQDFTKHTMPKDHKDPIYCRKKKTKKRRHSFKLVIDTKECLFIFCTN